MDIFEDIPIWKKQLQQQIINRNTNVHNFSNILDQLNHTQSNLNNALKRNSELEKSIQSIHSKKSSDIVHELCDTQLKLSKQLIIESELTDKIKHLETKLFATQSNIEHITNQKHDLLYKNKLISQELNKTRIEVCQITDEKIVLQLENNIMRTQLHQKNL